MVDNYLTRYQRKVRRRGATLKERNLNHKIREFNSYFKNTLNKESCLIDGVETELVFQDHSQSNNKDLSDDKYIIAPNTTKIDVGSYVVWRNSEWLVFTEEYKTIPTHQQLKVKHINETIKWITKNCKISNRGNGWGAYVQSQTLYTLGVAVSTNIQAVDSKMMMYMQNNIETSNLKIDDRLFIGQRIYKIKFRDTISRPGLINYLLDEDTIGAYDNEELRIANYYRQFKKDEEVPPVEVVIEGEKAPKIGKTYVYTVKDAAVMEWNIEAISAEMPCYILDKSETSVTLQFKNDFRYVGNAVNLIAKLKDESYASLTLNIAKRY